MNFFTLPKLHDYNGDLSKRWRVEFYKSDTPDILKIKENRIIIYISSRFKTKIERYEEYFRIKNEIENRIDNNTIEEPLLIDQIKEALDYKIKTLISKGSVKNFIYRANDLINWLKKKNKHKIIYKEFTVKDARDLIYDLYLTKNLENKTVNGYLSYLKPLFEYIKKTYEYEKNPFCYIENLRTKQPDIILWDATNIEILFNYTQQYEYPLYLISLLVFQCFLRVNEIAQIQLKDINFEQQIIFISSYKSKTKYSKTPTISNHLNKLLKDYIKKNKNAKPDYYLFSNNKLLIGAKAASRDYITQKFQNVRNFLRLPEYLKLYNLKHTGNSILFAAGVSKEELQRQNGHTEIRTTEIYIKRLNLKASKTIIKAWNNNKY